MSARLESAIHRVRAGGVHAEHDWNEGRAGRVLGGLRQKREARVARGRSVRRVLAAASGVAMLMLVLLRGASSAQAPAGSSTSASSLAPGSGEAFSPAPAAARGSARSELATRALDDGGYAQD